MKVGNLNEASGYLVDYGILTQEAQHTVRVKTFITVHSATRTAQFSQSNEPQSPSIEFVNITTTKQ